MFNDQQSLQYCDIKIQSCVYIIKRNRLFLHMVPNNNITIEKTKLCTYCASGTAVGKFHK